MGDAWAPPPPALWQWKHRTGFKDYDEAVSQRIEAAYRRGNPYVRLKTGKMKQTPMEIFFYDMIQHDPITGNQREIRRTGKETWCQMIQRKFGELVIAIETGRKYRMRFDQYIEARREVLKDLDKRAYTEASFYSEASLCARIARHPAFSILAVTAVLLNTLWLGVDANFNSAPTIWQADWGFQLVEHLFSLVFTAEIIIRFGALRRKKDMLRDGWLCFDALLVAIMVGENLAMLPVYLSNTDGDSASSIGNISILRLARLLRLTRLSRVARLLRAFPEVLTMMKGITHALRSVFMTFLLLVIVVYLFGIVFKIQSKSYPDLELFPTVVESMFVLLLQGAFLDAVADVVFEMLEISWILTFMFMVFVFLSNLTILNMLIGILCEVATNVNKREKDQAAVGYLKHHLLDILEVHDKHDDRHINKDDFELLMRNPEMHMILKNFGVDTEDLLSLQGILFETKTVVHADHSAADLDESTVVESKITREKSKVFPCEMKRLHFAEFLEVVLRLRGGNGASVRDVVDLREYLRQRIDHLQMHLSSLSLPVRFVNEDSPRLRMAGAGLDDPCGANGALRADLAPVLLQRLDELCEDFGAMRGQIQRLEGGTAATAAGEERPRPASATS